MLRISVVRISVMPETSSKTRAVLYPHLATLSRASQPASTTAADASTIRIVCRSNNLIHLAVTPQILAVSRIGALDAP